MEILLCISPLGAEMVLFLVCSGGCFIGLEMRTVLNLIIGD